MLDSPAPQSPEDVELVRRGARALIEHMSEGMKTVLSEIGSVSRWLTASLLAVNGAAAAAVFSAYEKLALPSGDAAFFLAGVLAALCSGVLLQRALIAGAQFAGEIIGHAIVVEQTGAFFEKAESLVNDMVAQSKRNSLWPELAGWLSAALFGAGAVLTGLTGFKVDIDNDHRCLALQRDILSAQPQKASGIALFQAFGCHAYGEGSVHVPEPRKGGIVRRHILQNR